MELIPEMIHSRIYLWPQRRPKDEHIRLSSSPIPVCVKEAEQGENERGDELKADEC